MARRKSKNKTGIDRIPGLPVHDAYVGYKCINCKQLNHVHIGPELLSPKEAFSESIWTCDHCQYIHSKDSDIPLENWDQEHRISENLPAERFWMAFFRNACEKPESFWKRCGSCDRILPFNSFSKHSNWGPLERQIECRSCKGAINAKLNPKRTAEQHRESSIRRRIADLFVEDQNEKIDISDLFSRFDNKCFKTKTPLNIEDRSSWQIDHIIPSKYLYPLTYQNAALLSTRANSNKRDKWPSKFYTNSELVELAKITGANLSLLASPKPIINKAIDVNNGIAKYLNVREHSNLQKRIDEIKHILKSYNLTGHVSDENKKILGIN